MVDRVEKSPSGDTVARIDGTVNLLDLTPRTAKVDKDSKSSSGVCPFDNSPYESPYVPQGQRITPAPAGPPRPLAEKTLDGLFKLDRTSNCKLSLPELSFEVGKRDEEAKYRNDWLDYGGRHPRGPSYDLQELRRLKSNFAQIAGPDGQISREEVLDYRQGWESLPGDFQRADSNGDLKLDRAELKEQVENPRLSRDFPTYNTYAHVEQNFGDAAGRDGKLSGKEWIDYLEKHPVKD